MGARNRYPGIRAFEPTETNLFFGRSDDSRELFTQVKAQPLVVLFAKSGIGKSSLLNAGLRPRLEDDFFLPIKIRLQEKSILPIDHVKKELQAFLKQDRLQQFTGQGAEEAPLWEFLRACDFGTQVIEEGEEPMQTIPTLIFDQFEEFFDHDVENRASLVEGLADLLSDRLPKRIHKELRAIKFKDRTDEIMDWYSPIKLKIVLAIRSDRLSFLDDLAQEIPIILRSRYHLKPFQEYQAREAIVEPAKLEGAGFLTPPFSYDEPTLDGILDYLSNKDGEIEAFQMQLVCQYVEREVYKRNQGS